MRWWLSRLGVVLTMVSGFVGWQSAHGHRIGVGERPSLEAVASTVAPAVTVPDLPSEARDATAPTFTPMQGGAETLTVMPQLGRIGVPQPCPPGIIRNLGGNSEAARCVVEVDLGGPFAFMSDDGHFQVWCEDRPNVYRPWLAIARAGTVVGTATSDFRTVTVVQLAPYQAGGPAEFVALRRDPLAEETSPVGCPTVAPLGLGTPVGELSSDPYVPNADGVLVALEQGGVQVLPTSTGIDARLIVTNSVNQP